MILLLKKTVLELYAVIAYNERMLDRYVDKMLQGRKI